MNLHKSSLSKTNMKTRSLGNTWSSLDEVLASFNSVSLMPGTRGDSDLFTKPSPPIHSISPSQLELIESMGGRQTDPPSPEIVTCVSRGRGRFMKTFEQKVNPKIWDEALKNDIRASKISTYSNMSIEQYFNDQAISNSGEEGSKDDGVSTSSEKDITCDDKADVSSDETVLNSSLRVEAQEFYPPGSAPNPLELTESLKKLKQSQSPKSPVGVNSKTGKRGFSPRSGKTEYRKRISPPQVNRIPIMKSVSVKDDNITFCISPYDDDTEVVETAKEVESSVESSPFCSKTSTPSQLLYTGSPSFLSSISPVPLPLLKEEVKPSLEAPDNTQEVTTIVKPPRQKRAGKNALFSNLFLKQQSDHHQHLMKPTDFGPGSSKFQPSSISAFHPFESKHSQPKDEQLVCSYDFKSDPSIDPKTKDLINELVQSESESSNSPSLSLNHSTSSSLSSTHSKLPKPLSFYDFSYQEKDFPPLS